MVAMQWQGGVLSLLDQGAYPQEEKWLTCNTWEETAQALATPAVQEEKVAAIAAAYGYAQAAIAAQDKLGTDAFQAALDQAKEQLLASRPGSRDVAAALAFVETPPEAYTKNADKLTAILATAVTFDRQQVVADRNLCRNGTDLMGEGTRILISASPTGALGIARRGWKRELLEQITLCEGRPSLTAGTLLAHELAREELVKHTPRKTIIHFD